MSQRLFQQPPPKGLLYIGAILVVLANAYMAFPGIAERLLTGDNDDLMRLVMVRDWLGGQGWFDAHQYRLMAPDGVLMHWSRYIDLGIAAIVVPASWFMPMVSAEHLALVLWPSLLLCLAILVVGVATERLLGRVAALGAVVIVLTLSTFSSQFVPGRIDHHNVQILCAAIAFYLAVLPGRPLLHGALAAFAMALSMAVGLEMLPFLLLVWAGVALRFAFGLAGAGAWLVAFGAAMTLAAPLLMAGQTPVAHWMINYCDVLAPPIMALFAAGIVATVLPVIAGKYLAGPVTRIGSMLGLSALGVWLAAPVLVPCLKGPYADVTPAARLIIDTRITEARSIPDLLGTNPELVTNLLLSSVLIGLMALVVVWRMRRSLDLTVMLALIHALVILSVGAGFAMTQIRATNLIAPVVPLLAGFVLWAFLRLPRQSRLRLPAALLLILAMPVTVRVLVTHIPMGATPASAAATPPPPLTNCRTEAAMAELAALPGSTLFSTLNLGAAILAYTPSRATSAPYHRSGAAFWNGIGAFDDEAALRGAIDQSHADFLVLCRGAEEETSLPYAMTLLSGDLPAWLSPTDYPQKAMLIWKVDHTALRVEAQSE